MKATVTPAARTGASQIRTLRRRRPKAAEVLAHQIQADIARLGLQPGDRLPKETEMIAEHGVSRATLREALRILEINGLISMRTGPNGGPTVRSATPGDFGRMIALFLQAKKITLGELLQARCLVEPMLVRDASQCGNPAFLRKVKALQSRGAALDIYDDDAYIEVSREFHELMACSSSNRVLSMFGMALMSMFVVELDRRKYPPEKRRQTIREHDLVLKAIIARRHDKAFEHMLGHMDALRVRVSGRQAADYKQVIDWM